MRRKKGQATVEFMLMLAVLVPIMVATISAINEKVFVKVNTWLKSEVVAQVRYGYSRKYLKDKFDENTAAVTSGEAPLKYGPETTSSKHPMARIKGGWF